MKVNKNYKQKYKNYKQTNKWSKKPYWNTNKSKNIIPTCSNQKEYEYFYDTSKNEWGKRIIK